MKHMLGAVAALRNDERFELKPGMHGLMGRRSPPRGGQVMARELTQSVP